MSNPMVSLVKFSLTFLLNCYSYHSNNPKLWGIGRKSLLQRELWRLQYVHDGAGLGLPQGCSHLCSSVSRSLPRYKTDTPHYTSALLGPSCPSGAVVRPTQNISTSSWNTAANRRISYHSRSCLKSPPGKTNLFDHE